jgi:3-hydroxy-4-methylanthranilate adenylyltransferase
MRGDWVDEILLAGPDDEVCLHLGAPVTRGQLRRLVTDRQERLAQIVDARRHSAVALILPPSLAFAANLLAAWRLGAQVALIDHRLTPHEVTGILERLAPEAVVSAGSRPPGGLRGYFDVDDVVSRHAGKEPQTRHVLLQLSSGSTGPSKVIGREAASLVAEVRRYDEMEGVPRRGERIVLLASMVHVLGLVGGLLYGLAQGVRLVVPERLTGDGILATVAAGREPTTLLGVPFHIELLSSLTESPKLAQLRAMTTGGELVRADVRDRFMDRFQIRLGNMYGMTEIGVIATDLFGEHPGQLAPAPGIEVRESNGELLLGMPASPYVGLSDPTRWTDGWLHTRDAGAVDPDTGLVRVMGRLDSQVSVGGLKVDLTEVEHTLAGLPEVAEAVVICDGAIEAYIVPRSPAGTDAIRGALAERLAAYKRPRVLHFVAALPRTRTGKLVRDAAALRAAGAPPST